jgi:hypothetical protein
MSNESLLEQLGLSPDPVFPASVKGKVDFSNQFSNLLPSNPTGIAPVISPVIDSTAYSGLEGVAPGVPDVPRSFGVSTPASEVTTNVGGIEVTGNKEIVDNVKNYAETAGSDELLPLLTALAAAGLISSLISSGPAKIEVSGQSETPAPKPTEPPPATTTPPPVIPAPVSPPTTDTTTTSTSPNPTEDELIKAGVPKELLPLLLKYGLGALASYLSYKSAKDAQEQAKGASFTSRGPVTSTRRAYKGSTYKPAAQGGLMTLAGGGVLNEKGPEDYGIGSLAEDMSIGEYEPEQFNSDTFYQAYANDVYAPEGLIANEVVRRAAFEMPETFDPRNLAFQKEKEASINEARNRLLSEVMSVDQITGDIDPIQSIKNIAAYDPTFLQSVPDLRKFVENVQSLSPTGYDAKYGFKAPYADKFTPEDIRTVRVFGPEYQNMLDVIGNILENREGDYTTGGIGGGYGGAAGGLASAKQPFYLGGPTDGMADEVPAHIDNKRPAALSDGEFVIPADVVSHLGNGNSNAGASRLYEMMDRVREARTGNRKQGIQINPNKFMPR